MFLHHSAATTMLTRALLCGTQRQAVLTCSLRQPRCPSGGCTAPMYCRGIHTAFMCQHTRWHWWLGHQEMSQTCGRHQVPLGIVRSDAAQCSTWSTLSGRAHSTGKEGGMVLASDAPIEDEVDFKALVELEVELYRQEGYPVPSNITPVQWDQLLSRHSVNSRKKYLTFLFKNEMKRLNKMKIKEIKREKREEEERQRKENPPPEGQHIQYGLWRNSIFIKILEPAINHFYHSRVVQAMLYGQPLVVDLDFEEQMSPQERQNCAYQIQMMISVNRKHEDPYNLELHNTLASQDLMTRLERYVPTLYNPEYPVNINPKSYLEKYPKEQLVYLTPHCQEELSVYDHDAVYIIGGIVDKSSGEPLSLAKAKKEGIRMQKLPLDRHLQWGIGNKCLTLNQIISIMLDFKVSGDWSHALQHVPRRKLKLPLSAQQGKEEALLQRIKHRERGYRKY